MKAECNLQSLQESSGDDESVYNSTSASTLDNADAKDTALLGGRETKLVNGSKLLVYLVLLCVTAAVTTMAYLFLRNEEANNMELEFKSYSREILKQAQANAVEMFEELWGVSTAITSHALETESKWPNVTLPHFDRHAFREHHDKKSQLEFVAFAPYITPLTREGWIAYTQDQDWLSQDYLYRAWEEGTPFTASGGEMPSDIHRFNESAPAVEFNETDYQYEIPLWQLAPPPRDDKSMLLMDLATVPVLAHLLRDIKVKKVEQYGRDMDLSFIMGSSHDDHPRGTIFQPVFDNFGDDAEVVGFLMGSLTWDNIFQDVLFDAVAPLLVEIEGNCTSRFTYEIDGKDDAFLGYGDVLREVSFDGYKQSTPLLTPLNSRPGYPPVEHTHRSTDASHPASHCEYQMNAYPTAVFVMEYQTREPLWFAFAALAIFAFTAGVFIIYDILVARRQAVLMNTATKTSALVSALYPKAVRDRMMNNIDNQAFNPRKKAMPFAGRAGANSSAVQNGLVEEQDGMDNDGQLMGAPIADLFPEATVMFADIVGFTAWANCREPTAVFHLLESLYGCFDQIARRRGVFKVETIGDCYVAVCGLPQPRIDHAVTMVRFARECLFKMQRRLVDLESTLGPDTTTLGMRVGLHTGSVTAGVLRGDKGRFQLFGDTVNTTARIESTGAKNRVHLSQKTAEDLIRFEKGHWIEERNDCVEAKGLGKIQTYWLKSSDVEGSATVSGQSTSTDEEYEDPRRARHLPLESHSSPNGPNMRVVDYMVDVLAISLKKIHVKRGTRQFAYNAHDDVLSLEISLGNGTIGLDQFAEVINFPKPEIVLQEACDLLPNQDWREVALGQDVLSQLRSYISQLAERYCNNPFHSFAHAVHVTQAVTMLLTRISKEDTYGITTDPLTVFSITLSALVHDLDHPGVPNFLLAQENQELGRKYKERAIAEQHSIDLAWNLLMKPQYQALRSAIYTNVKELAFFRQVIVNCLLATDIFDKELSKVRKHRWEEAFGQGGGPNNPEGDLKATILVENIIQAADVSHMMQSWPVYIKWNSLLYQEMYFSYRSGRSTTDPTTNWYTGELAFFDSYIIPLAQKLQESNLFGIHNDEFLKYATSNRREWELRGKDVVLANLSKCRKMWEQNSHIG